MSDKHVLDELSAYVDGHATQPERIARHLQHCEACARRRMELLKLSAHLRGLPEPDPNPEFLARVLARIEEAPRNVVPFRPALWLSAFTGLAAALLLTALGLYALSLNAPTAPPAARAWPSEEVLVEEVSEWLVAGVDIAALEGQLAPALGGEEETAPEQDIESLDEMLAMMAVSSEATESLEESDEDADLYAAIQDMDPGEVDLLKEMLSDYLNEG